MEEKVGGAENKKKKGEQVLNEQGKTFYEAIPATITMPKAIHLPKMKTSTVDLLEGIAIFFVGTAEVLLITRLVILEFGANGGNLLTYLLYALSYPFVAVLGSTQGQIPVKTASSAFEMLALMFIYFLAFYLASRLLHFFEK